MRELAGRALNVAQLQGASYADVRIVRRETQSIAVKNGQVGELKQDEDQGLGVRVIADGAWGRSGWPGWRWSSPGRAPWCGGRR